MLPGPTYVYQCPGCSHLLANDSLLSGNTFGAKLYSDGKQFAPMLPVFPRLTRCPSCDTIFWLNKSTEAGSYSWGDNSHPEWEQADKAEFLQLPEYFVALGRGLANTKEEEIYLRQQIWWAYNDRSRRGQELFQAPEDEANYTENCKRLMTLLDPTDPNQRIMLAELKRNLGDFEGCKKLIDSLEDASLKWLKVKFAEACAKKYPWVMALN